MSFNLDPSKQAQKTVFSPKVLKPVHTPLIFSNNNVSQTLSQKHIEIIFEERFTRNLNVYIILFILQVREP